MDNTPRYVLEMQIFKIYLKQNKKTNLKSDNENETETKSETETETEQRSKCDCDRAKRERSILYHDGATCDLARASDLAMQSLFCRPTSGRIVATCPETHTECEREMQDTHSLSLMMSGLMQMRWKDFDGNQNKKLLKAAPSARN